THLRLALELAPGFGDAVRNMGALAARGKLDRKTRREIAVKLVKQGDYDRALDVLSELVRELPDDAELHNNLGVALYFKKDYGGASEQFKLALKINPAFDEAQRNLDAALQGH